MGSLYRELVRPAPIIKSQKHVEYQSRHAANYISSLVYQLSGNRELTSIELQKAYDTNPFAKRSIGWLAQTAAKLPYKIVNEQKEDVKDDPVFSVFKKPNKDMNRSEFIELLIVDHCTCGNWFIEPVGSRSKLFGDLDKFKIREMILLNPVEFSLDIGTDGYIERITEQGNRIVYKPSNIIFGREISASNRKVGVGRLKSAQRALIALGLLQSFVDSFFIKGGHLGTYFSTPEELSDSSFAQNMERLKQAYEGVDKAFGVTLLDKNLKAESLDISTPLEAGFEQAVQVWKEQIFAAVGTPVTIVDGGEANYSNYDTALRSAYDQGLIPILVRIEEEFTNILPKGYSYEFDLSDVEVLQTDQTPKKEVTIKAKITGILTTNEAREEFGLEPIGEGDELEEKGSLSGQVKEEDDQLTKSIYSIFDKQVEKAEKIELFKSGNKAEKKKVEKIMSKIEDKHLDKVKAVYSEIIDKTQDIIKGYSSLDKSTIPQIESAVSTYLGGVVISFNPLATDIINEASEKGFSHISGKMKSDGVYNIGSKKAKSFIDQRTNLIAKSVGDTLTLRVKKALKQALEQGLSIDEAAKLIKNESALGFQARRLAQTEITNAYNYASLEAMTANGAKYKQWLDSNDSRVRPEHALIDEEIRAIKEPFSNGLMFPSEPNCRCFITWVNLEAIGLPVEDLAA